MAPDAPIPVVSFRQVPGNEYATAPADLPPAIRAYGYNALDEGWERTEHYVRYIEPIEAELAKQVEYDMDEQDREWLEVVNVERAKEQVDKLSYEVFEIIMDRLEKEWFDLMKRIPTPASALPVEDSRCAICDDSEGENANAIVFCDGCNLAVHQDCYGVPYIPEGQWLCRKCTVSPENPVDCILCPGEAGAFKQTAFPSAQWAHLLCAIWIPEVGVGNTVYMEPIEGVEGIPKSRWRLICSICKIKSGACIQCDNRNCFTAFHVTCARSEGLLSSMKSLGSDGVLKAYCQRHLPADHWTLNRTDEEDEEEEYAPTPDASDAPPTGPRARKKPLRLRDDSDDEAAHAQRRPRVAAAQSKSARAHAKLYTSGPPLVPHLIVKNLMEYIKRIVVRKKLPLVERICRYWSLKREARRGAPLLKRLHLEPWTASHESKEQSDADKAKKMEYLGLIRNDLERVRMLAELVRKREKEKLRQAQIFRDLLDDFVYPHDGRLRLALEKISALDRSEIFLNPVNRRDVPDYYDVIKQPMCWSGIDDKLERHLYGDVQSFISDVRLVLDNAMLYNPKDHAIHKLASRISTSANPILEELARTIDAALPTELVGKSRSLEAPASRLESLLAPQGAEDSPSLLDDLFAFRLEPPPVPEPVVAPKPKRSVLSAEEAKARKEARKARFSNPAPLPMRATRTTEKLKEDQEAELAQQQADLDLAASLNGRRRTRSGAPSVAGVAEGSPSQTPLSKQKRPQKGIAGLAPYSPLSEGERRRREERLDMVVDHVDEKDHFKRFNVGWVLPEGVKRGGRAPPPPASSVSRKSRGTSQASSAVPQASEASAGRPSFVKSTSSSSLSDLPDRSSPLSDPDDEPMPLASTPAAESSAMAATRAKRSHKRKTSEERVAPANKKQKLAKEDAKAIPPAEKGPAVLADIIASGSAASSRRSSKAASGRSRAAAKATEEVQDVSMERDATIVEDDTVQPAEEEDIDPIRTERLAALGGWNNGNDREEEGDLYPHGTLVWAKTLGFCFFPAEIVDIADDYYDLPGGVWTSKPEGEATRLVRFFDATRSYAWCPESRLDLLGESDEIDQGYLAGKNKGSSGRFRTPQMGKLCRAAYREAKYQMDIGDGAE